MTASGPFQPVVYQVKNAQEAFNALANRFLQRDLIDSDAIDPSLIAEAERRLEIKLPDSLRAFYLIAGGCTEFNSVHNYLYAPADLELSDGYLVFMDENQSVVSWGFRESDLDAADPIVWQRNNTENAWYSEEKSLTPFLESMFEFYADIDAWDDDL